jgi:hypothetical protein
VYYSGVNIYLYFKYKEKTANFDQIAHLHLITDELIADVLQNLIDEYMILIMRASALYVAGRGRFAAEAAKKA